METEKQLVEKDPSEFVMHLINLEAEVNRSMSVGLEINNVLHNIKWNGPEKDDKSVDIKQNEDLIGRFYVVIEKLRQANDLHDKNFYKLNKLF